MAEKPASNVQEIAKKFSIVQKPSVKPRVPNKPIGISASSSNIANEEKENKIKRFDRPSIKAVSPQLPFSLDTINAARGHLKKTTSGNLDGPEKEKEAKIENPLQLNSTMLTDEIKTMNNNADQINSLKPEKSENDNSLKSNSTKLPPRRQLPPLLGPPPKKPAKLQNFKFPKNLGKVSIVEEKKVKMDVPLPPVPLDDDELEVYDDVTSEDKERIPSPIQELTEEEEMGSNRPINPVMKGRSLPQVPPTDSFGPSSEIGGEDVYDMVDKEDQLEESEDIYEIFDTPSDNVKSEELPSKSFEKDTKEKDKKEEKKGKKEKFSQEKEKVVKDHKVKKEKIPNIISNIDGEIYDDVQESNMIRTESQESLNSSVSSKSSMNTREEEKNKELEKEKKRVDKEKEKREKKEKKEEEKKEKERAKIVKKAKDKEMKEIKKKYNLKADELDKVLGYGTVISNSTGEELELPVWHGDKVTIIRMEGNPPNKWLAKDKHGKIGYVEAGSVEMDKDDEQEMYADVVDVDVEVGGEEIYEDVIS